ncbi:MAG: hypothetical protein IPO92_07690 [Saprospiraceae bacterium]|nr:hypothetical protein [Saprospiraceae bacterium]
MTGKWFSFCLLILMSIFTQKVYACDVCGCAVSGHQFGILPQFQKHFVGIRYNYRSFQSVHPPLFSTDTEKVSREYFHTTDIWGRYILSDRVQLFGFVPLHHITKEEDNTTLTQKGLGDITIMGMYAIINQRTSDNGRWIHHLQAGGGIKLPTGAHDYYTGENEWIPGIQKGTGTIDFMLNTNYLLRYDEIGLSAEVGWRVNGHNTMQDFRYGQRLTTGIRSFYILHAGKNSFMPSLGCVLEQSGKDDHEGTTVDLSGGSAFFGHVGLDFFSNGFTAGFSIQPSVIQNVANGNLTSGTRFNAQFAVLF